MARLDRLRVGELVMFVASIALVVDITAFPWYSLRPVYNPGLAGLGKGGGNFSAGWAFHILIPLAIVCIMLTWAICIAQVLRKGPAVPLAMTVIGTILNIILTVGLLVRVVFDQPTLINSGTGGNMIRPDIASIFGLFFAVALLVGGWVALRTDGLAAADNPRRIETLRLAPRSR